MGVRLRGLSEERYCRWWVHRIGIDSVPFYAENEPLTERAIAMVMQALDAGAVVGLMDVDDDRSKPVLL